MSDDFKKYLINKIAAEREEMHKNDSSGRQLTENTHEAGLEGELAFAKLCGIHPDLTKKRTGDGGIDFIVPIFMSLDVKARNERPGGLPNTFLLVEEKKVIADIYVLAIIYDDGSPTECVGWMRKDKILEYPIGDLGTGVINHQVPALDLHKMDTLLSRMLRFPRPEDWQK